MNVAFIKSLIRHLLGAALAAVATVLATPADLSLEVVLLAVGSACVPVLAKALDPGEPEFGLDASDSGESDIGLILLVAIFVGVVLLLFGVSLNK
jgi:hypothetical protein